MFIDNESTNNIDATTDTFNVGLGGAPVVGSLLSLAEAFAVEDKIVHQVDVATFGFVRVKAGNVYVTANSFLAPFTTAPSIQRGIDAASAGDTVNVGAGTFAENLTISKALTLRGAEFGQDANVR